MAQSAVAAVVFQTYIRDKIFKIPKKRVNYGSGWVGPGLTRIFFLQNSPIQALIFLDSIPCVHIRY